MTTAELMSLADMYALLSITELKEKSATAREALLKALVDQADHMVFIERWAVHHASKPHLTPAAALDIIVHYPPIKRITQSYVDGKVPTTFDPYAEIERLKAELKKLLPKVGETCKPVQARLYYEAHVTIEPVFEGVLNLAKTLAADHGFRVADLLMQKREEATAERSKNDTFMTGHSRNYEDILVRTKLLVEALIANEYKVWRYKIEDTILDSRHDGDVFGQLLTEKT